MSLVATILLALVLEGIISISLLLYFYFLLAEEKDLRSMIFILNHTKHRFRKNPTCPLCKDD